jgi:hypothetical protein
MKRLNYITGFLGALLLLSSCTGWIENADPRGLTAEADAFLSEKGYQDILIGAYGAMAKPALYGEQATMGIPEHLAGHWASTSNTSAEYGYQHYDNASYRTQDVMKTSTNALWTNYYKVISQLNVLLEHLQTSDVAFSGNMRAIIEGEARGLRAFLHLDLLRFFGPAPAQGTTNPTNLYLPYVTEITYKAEDLAPDSWDSYVWNLRQDLGAAQLLLSDIDPIEIYALSGTENVPVDEFLLRRKSRFNYWAAVATEARLESWLGCGNPSSPHTKRAAELARSVIEAKGFGGVTLFPLANGTNMRIERTLNQEFIFGIEYPKLYETIETRYLGAITVSSGNVVNRLRPVYAIGVGAVDDLYTSTDWRGNKRNTDYWVVSSDPSVYAYRKYVNEIFEGGDKAPLNRVACIRIAEMYMLVFEGESSTSAARNALLNEYITARDLGAEGSEAVIINAMDDQIKMNRGGQIEKEYHKEFYGEGQMFFFYKRNNYSRFVWPGNRTITNPEQFYQLQIPEDTYWNFYFTNY